MKEHKEHRVSKNMPVVLKAIILSVVYVTDQ